MSLIKLLSVSQSLVGGRNQPGRYKMADQNLLPKFAPVGRPISLAPKRKPQEALTQNESDKAKPWTRASGIESADVGIRFYVTATGGQSQAQTSFTDASTDATFVDYAQCANGAPPSTSLQCPSGWINGRDCHYGFDETSARRLCERHSSFNELVPPAQQSFRDSAGGEDQFTASGPTGVVARRSEARAKRSKRCRFGSGVGET